MLSAIPFPLSSLVQEKKKKEKSEQKIPREMENLSYGHPDISL